MPEPPAGHLGSAELIRSPVMTTYLERAGRQEEVTLSCQHLHEIRYAVDEKETEFTLFVLQVCTFCPALSMPGSWMLLTGPRPKYTSMPFGYPRPLLKGIGQK